MNERRPLWSWLLFAQLALVVFATVFATMGYLPPVCFRSPADKVGHLLAYGLLAFFGVAFFGQARRWAVVGAFLLAATLEELAQRGFPTRTFDVGDLAANAAGICAVGVASCLFRFCTSPREAGRGRRPQAGG